MKFTRGLRGIICAFGFLLSALGSSQCRADCEHAAYAYEDRVVVFACSKTGGPELRIILLDDAGPLKVAGRVGVPSARSFDTAAHFNNFLMLLRHDQFEIYDLAKPTHPAFAAKFDIKKRENSPGYERIEQTASNKFLVLTALGAVEVTADGEPTKWNITEIPPNQELHNKMSGRPPEWRLLDRNERAVVVHATNTFRYELGWKEKSSPGEIWHRQYLRKVEVATQQVVAQMLLGQQLETID